VSVSPTSLSLLRRGYQVAVETYIGDTRRGLVQFASADELAAQETADYEAKNKPPPPVIGNLAAHVRTCFERAKQHRSLYITPRYADCMRRVSGEYDAAKLAQIIARDGSQLYFNITVTKTTAAEAWIRDVILPVGDKPFQIEPTPIAELPQDVKAGVVGDVVQAFRGIPIGQIDPAQVADLALQTRDKAQAELQEEARTRCGRMEQKIDDQFVEGGFYDALSAFVQSLTTFPIAILCGPIPMTTKRLSWENGPGQPVVTSRVLPTWFCVNPQDFYPSPAARTPQDDFICEALRIPPADLAGMRGVSGWSSEAIDRVLERFPQGGDASPVQDVPGASERALQESRDISYSGAIIEGVVRFFGTVKGSLLQEWGVSVTDLNMFYEAHVILIGHEVVYAVLNPDPLGRRPYYVTSYQKLFGSLYGRAIPEKMADCQDGCGAAIRNMIDNLALASGFQTQVDIDAMAPGESLTQVFPGRVWQYNGTKMPQTGSRRPVEFFQPDANVAALIEVAEYFETKADDRTLIPRFAHGNDEMSGAGRTASGLGMLMNAASKGIRQVIANIDQDVIRPAVRMQFDWNMMQAEFGPDIKGDVLIVPRGITAILVRDMVQARRQEFLQQTANEQDRVIVGVRERRNLLAEVAKGLDIPADKVVPSEQELMERIQKDQIAAQQAEQAQFEQSRAELMGGTATQTAP